MNYVFCGAPKALLFALYLKNVLEEKTTVVTYDKDLIKYCENEGINYIQFEFVEYKFMSIYRAYALKKILDDIIKKIDIGKNDKAFLVGLPMKGYEFLYLAKELSKKGVVHYRNPHDRQLNLYKPPRYKPIFVRGAIIRLVLKIVLGLDLIYYEYNNNPILGVDDKFFKKYNISEYLPDVSSIELSLDVVKKTKGSYKEYDNVIIDDCAPLESVTKFDSTLKLYEKLFELHVDFAFKRHPHPNMKSEENQRSKPYYKLFKHCEEVPRYIPAELLCNNIKKTMISIQSSTLITASQMPHLKVISLLELVDWHNDSYKKEFKNYFKEQSKNKIIFPKSFEELKEILLRS